MYLNEMIYNCWLIFTSTALPHERPLPSHSNTNSLKLFCRCVIAKKKFKKLGGSTGATRRRFSEFPLLKVGFGAISEVILSAPWRSNTSLEGIFISSHTQILEFWSQNQFFPLGSFEDAHVPERRILPQFPNKAFFTNVLKTKVAPNDKKTC